MMRSLNGRFSKMSHGKMRWKTFVAIMTGMIFGQLIPTPDDVFYVWIISRPEFIQQYPKWIQMTILLITWYLAPALSMLFLFTVIYLIYRTRLVRRGGVKDEIQVAGFLLIIIVFSFVTTISLILRYVA